MNVSQLIVSQLNVSQLNVSQLKRQLTNTEGIVATNTYTRFLDVSTDPKIDKRSISSEVLMSHLCHNKCTNFHETCTPNVIRYMGQEKLATTINLRRTRNIVSN